MLVFPVRHHSPAAALRVAHLIRERKPRAVLVEGPADATPLIPLLLDAATEPPVALYAYRAGDEGRASFYPFCEYSPEYVALKQGFREGARLAFCDLPSGAMMDWRESLPGNPPGPREPVPDPGVPAATDYADFSRALADAAGFDSFEALWEAEFEQRAGADVAGGYTGLLSDFGMRARALTPELHQEHDWLRERHMAAEARALAADGLAEDELLLVCGAAHLEGVTRAYREHAQLHALEGVQPAVVTLVPFSFPRLSEQSGYGAGNRAPWFYQQVWELGGDYEAATRAALARLARRLREQGHAASLAQCIDAFNLARVLASMRGKLAPGVDELVEAAVACLGQGQAGLVSAALHQVLIGDAVGRVTYQVGRTPLQAEFYATAQRLGLPVLDAPRQVLLHMTIPKEVEQSVFLHRLVVADVPYGRELESGLGGRGRASQAGPLEQLARVREKWELQWSPATDAQLVERTAWGSTLTEVCGRLLDRELERATTVDAGAEILLRMALCELGDPFAAALTRCEALAADSRSFPALARAAYCLDGLLSYGAARRLPLDRLAALAERLFTRAVLHLPASAICGDEAAQEIAAALTPLYELVGRKSSVANEGDAFWAAVENVAGMEHSHPSLRGLALVLLNLGGGLSREALSARLRYWLSATAEAADNALLVAGIFSLHRGTLVRDRALIGAVTDFLLGLDVQQLIPLLPVLRRSLGSLSAAERAYLEETLAAVLELSGAGARAPELTPDQVARLRAADATVAEILVEWKDRYGIR